ncbi:MAG: adenosylcobinamide-phosphate synthase CbiB [Ahrensia sp.]
MADWSTLTILFVALLLDRFVGDPDWLWRHVPHPVVLFGKAIGWADKRFNDVTRADITREKYGFATIAVLVIVSVVVGWLLSALFAAAGTIGTLTEIVLVAVFLAQKSLAQHVAAVANGLRSDGLAGGRRAVAMIVGRDPDSLDNAGICRAAIESLAENASDGVVAPAFWYAVFGLPGLLAYKMINTADSMIGHMTPRYQAFGRASARLDDWANWVPARVTAGLIALVGLLPTTRRSAIDIAEIVLEDAQLHRSPNAGWPESAMAATLNISLGGPRFYADDVADEPFMNDAGRKQVAAIDIDKAISIFWWAMSFGTALVALLAVIF